MKVFGYGTKSKENDLSTVTFERREPRRGEVAIKVTHCGVCHSDLHQVKNDWSNTIYPCVPGHEVVGVISAVGEGVSTLSEGDIVGVGCMINSCQECESCENNEENYCTGPKSCTLTYNGPKKPDGSNTYGGYSTELVVREEFVLKVPSKLEPKYVGPLMCAGITVYSPMKHWNLKKGQHLGVAGIGGLGHMAIKFGKVMGAEVTAFTRSEDKRDEILEMGADKVVISEDDEQMNECAKSLDMLINTIPVPHDISPYIDLMKTDSILVVVGNMVKFPEFSPGPLIFNRITLAGSLIGGIKETGEVLDLAAEHNIKPLIKIVDISEINDVLEKLKTGEDGCFRFVIDMQSLHNLSDGTKDGAMKLMLRKEEML